MTSSIRLSLKSGQQIYINGAVLKADRKVTLELLNKAAFLLPQHIVSADQAQTPLRQLYFLIQTALIDPALAATMEPMIAERLDGLAGACAHQAIADGLARVKVCVAHKNPFEALKVLRGLFPLEALALVARSETAAPADGA